MDTSPRVLAQRRRIDGVFGRTTSAAGAAEPARVMGQSPTPGHTVQRAAESPNAKMDAGAKLLALVGGLEHTALEAYRVGNEADRRDADKLMEKLGKLREVVHGGDEKAQAETLAAVQQELRSVPQADATAPAVTQRASATPPVQRLGGLAIAGITVAAVVGLGALVYGVRRCLRRSTAAPAGGAPAPQHQGQAAPGPAAPQPQGQAAPAAGQQVSEILIDSIRAMQNNLQQDLLAIGGGVSLRNYANMLLDLTSAQIDESIANAYGSDAILRHYLSSTLDYSSCFPAADRLLNLLGSNAANAQQQQGGAGPTIVGSANQTGHMANLIQALRHAHDNGPATVFRIGLAGHGFVLVVRQNRIEHLEAVAHAADLITSVLDGPTYTMTQAATALNQMVSNTAAGRTAGATAFGWNAGPLGLLDRNDADTEFILKYYGLVWRSRPMVSVQVLRNRLAARIQANRVAVYRGLGLGQPQ